MFLPCVRTSKAKNAMDHLSGFNVAGRPGPELAACFNSVASKRDLWDFGMLQLRVGWKVLGAVVL